MALSDLGTTALSWRRLGVLLRQLPIESRFIRVVGDKSLAWSPEMHFLALIADLLAGANWQRSGGKGKKPTPIERPGQVDDRDSRRLGTAHTIEEMRVILDTWDDGGEPSQSS